MLDSDRKKHIQNTIKMLTDFLAEHDEVMRRLSNMLAGYKSGHEGAAAGTERPDFLSDFAQREIKKVNAAVLNAKTKADDIEGVRLSVMRVSAKLSDIGECCELIAKHAPKSWELAVYHSDVVGRLPRKYKLGRWAYDKVMENGEPNSQDGSNLPTAEEVQNHVRGIRVRRTTRRAS